METEMDIVPEFMINRLETVIDPQRPNVLHYHNGYEIDLFISSSNQCFVKDIRYEVKDRTLLITMPYEVHKFYYQPGTNYTRFVINFREEFLLPLLKAQNCDDLLEKIQRMPYRQLSLNGEILNRLTFLFTELLTLFNKKKPPKSLIQSYLLCILQEIYLKRDAFQTSIQLSKSGLLVQQIIRYIDSHYMEPITLEILENSFFINRYHLCHVFKKETDSSITSYIQYRRIIEAQKLLLYSNQPIIDICYQCGFNNLQHFYRIFKKLIGYTPQQYRIKIENSL